MFKSGLRLALVTSLFVLFQNCAHQAPTKATADARYLTASTLWFQSAAEYRALAYQAYNVAKDSLDQELKKGSKRNGKTLAVVLDLDETVLDNSEYQGYNILHNKGYSSESWKKWTDLASAKAIPGAVEFLQYAQKKGVEIFYITNRKENEFESTYKNLTALSIPVKKENLLTRVKASNKQDRRDYVSARYQIVMLVGDNMNDFSDLYEKKNVADRAKVTDDLQKDFGHKFIVLPNPMYGDWESALYNYDFSKSEQDKEAMRNSSLKSTQVKLDKEE